MTSCGMLGAIAFVLVIMSRAALSAFASEAALAGAYRWAQEAQAFVAIGESEDLAAASVLWIKSANHAVLNVKGNYSEPLGQPIPASGLFSGANGLEAVELADLLPTNAAAWNYNRVRQTWRVQLDQNLRPENQLASLTLAPGQAVFIRAAEPADVVPPNDAFDICYYHQDHLGSATVLTDRLGGLVQQTTFYPFGSVRKGSKTLDQFDASYRYTGKESDGESGLYYYEARYYAPGLGRFLSVDPLYAKSKQAADSVRSLSPYAYVRNNPIRSVDPTGMQEEEATIVVPRTIITASPGETPSNEWGPPQRSEFASYAAYASAMRGYNRYRKELRNLAAAPKKKPEAPAFGQPFSDQRVQRILAYHLDKARRMGAETREEQITGALSSVISAREKPGFGKDLNYAAADHYLTMRWNAYQNPHFYKILWGWASIETYDAIKAVTGVDANASEPDPRVRDWAYRGVSAGSSDAFAEHHGPLPLIESSPSK